jgi:hypothetical protein
MPEIEEAEQAPKLAGDAFARHALEDAVAHLSPLSGASRPLTIGAGQPRLVSGWGRLSPLVSGI